MKKKIEGFTDHLSNALQIGAEIRLPTSKHVIKNVLVAGMGGSGIGANIVQSLISSELAIPMIVAKGYTIPRFVGPETLFIACSYSGHTEETLTALREALSKKAQVICITSGGSMAQLANNNKISIFPMPAGSSSPRAMLGYAIVFLLYALQLSELIPATFVEETQEAVLCLDRDTLKMQQQAQAVAKKIKGKLPIIYSDETTDAIAVRFQNQLNENSKHLAHVNTFPEMNHNEIVGWVYPKNLFAQLQPIYIQTSHAHERVNKRMQICRPLLEKNTLPIVDILAQGKTLLAQYYFLIHFTDWVSYFLALENDVDPEPVEVIAQLKEALKKT